MSDTTSEWAVEWLDRFDEVYPTISINTDVRSVLDGREYEIPILGGKKIQIGFEGDLLGFSTVDR